MQKPFFYATYFNYLKSFSVLFFCPLLVTILLQKDDTLFHYILSTLKKYLTYYRGE